MTFTKLCIGSLLGISTVIDIKTRKVSFKILVLYGALGMLNLVFFDGQNLYAALGGALIGIFVLGISKLTRGGIGMGDGFLIIVTGVFLGTWKNIELLLGSFFLAAIFSVFYLIVKKKNDKKEIRKKEIPLVPFLFLSFLGTVFF